MKKYLHNAIILNGREVYIHDILNETVTSTSQFEVDTLTFIKDWLNDVEHYTLTTSGSTGTPTVIKLQKSQLQASARMTIRALQLNESDVALVCLNTQYIAGKMMLARALEAGMKLLIVEPSSNPLLKLKIPFTFAAFVPFQLQTIIESGETLQQLNNVKAIIVGGATVNDILKKEVQRINTPVYATYGMTETISHIALQRLNGNSIQSCFHILEGIKIDTDVRGCLIIQTPYLPEQIITNDLVEILNITAFTWLGRWDNIINTGGVKVLPERIEIQITAIFKKLGINRNFYIGGIADDRLGQHVVLYIEGEKLEQEDLILGMLKPSLTKFEMPKEIIMISQFTYTPTGKIIRKQNLL